MGMIDRLLTGPGIAAAGNAVSGVAEVFRQNETRRMELDEEAYARAIGQMGQEFAHAPSTWFDSFVNGLNRLPRPAMTFGVLGMFVYAMADPDGFSLRMEGLQAVPEPLWWFLGAVVSFYFGAREAHYFRSRVWPARKVTRTTVAGDAAAASGAAPTGTPGAGWAGAIAASGAATAETTTTIAAGAPAGTGRPAAGDDFADNPALRDWWAARQG